MPIITFYQQKRVLQVKEGIELLQLTHLDSTVTLKFSCCHGECGTCAIKILKGENNLSPKTKQEQITLKCMQLTSSHRLACQCAVQGDVIIDA